MQPPFIVVEKLEPGTWWENINQPLSLELLCGIVFGGWFKASVKPACYEHSPWVVLNWEVPFLNKNFRILFG
jgi:hypothetical protein